VRDGRSQLLAQVPVTDVVATLWGFCHTLRHDGVDYADYVEQLAYLLFLKMADERDLSFPGSEAWAVLRSMHGPDLTLAYSDALTSFSHADGMLGEIFSGAESRIQNPASLARLIELVDQTRWTELDVDVKAAAFEGLLEKAAAEGKKGAGQYFTPRPLVEAIVECARPAPKGGGEFLVGDPACGTAGFLVRAFEWRKQRSRQDSSSGHDGVSYRGQELASRPRRLALMNLYLHGIDAEVHQADSIYGAPGSDRYDVILTNPPFGSRGANHIPTRTDFGVQTSDKALNFLQHCASVLKPSGRCAIVVPDSALFTNQGCDVMRLLMAECDVHTLLRCPRGTFAPYTDGTKANVLFFTKGARTRSTWIYDARTNVLQVTKRSRPLSADHFREFQRCYGEDADGHAERSEQDSAEGRWRAFTAADIAATGFNLDGFHWLTSLKSEEIGSLGEADELLADVEGSMAEALQMLEHLRRFVGDAGARP
jgi:type I restriction enzyme M protein